MSVKKVEAPSGGWMRDPHVIVLVFVIVVTAVAVYVALNRRVNFGGLAEGEKVFAKAIDGSGRCFSLLDAGDGGTIVKPVKCPVEPSP